ncbi:hypothetical protein [Segatella oulorum]|uniref:hypothetical protein n=1 Tax=Segatella oulorum TaxID=28136 RepID=UPI0003189040|nr:hypothetical protein [Segatella oulorum]
METPLRGRSGGHAGTAPTVSLGRLRMGRLISLGQIARGMGDFVWVDCVWTVDVVWMDCP